MKKIVLILLPILFFNLPVSHADESYIRYQEPDFLNFEELKVLAHDPNPGGALQKKLERFWTTPLISNEAYYSGVHPRELVHPKLGRNLRVATWNIEKSFNIPKAIELLTDASSMPGMLDKRRVSPYSLIYKKMVRQRNRLVDADILIFQEMDIGVKRSGYLNAAEELAKALKMNFAYGAQQLEIDPVILGLEQVPFKSGKVDQESTDFFAADPQKYKGVFGSAVLSRYPIKNVEVFQLQNQAYDWYWGEKPKTTYVESAKRVGTKLIFKNIMTREMKVGGRIFFRVDLDVPEIPEKTLTVINVHLEIKCQPKDREIQMAEILGYIKNIRNPVILAGDFNAAPNDISPTSLTRIIKRTASNPTTWFSAAVSYLSPYALAINTTRTVTNVTKNFQNPLGRHIPVIAPNPVRGLFDLIEDYRFADGGAFDFRGDVKRSINGKSATLANSNQRDTKGFKTTFQVKRPIGPWLGKLRLDWFFMKAYLKEPKEELGSYKLAPHFGETLEEMNAYLDPPISDHHPNVVDLPFEESIQKTL